jgi:hypothetical protein
LTFAIYGAVGTRITATGRASVGTAAGIIITAASVVTAVICSFVIIIAIIKTHIFAPTAIRAIDITITVPAIQARQVAIFAATA